MDDWSFWDMLFSRRKRKARAQPVEVVNASPGRPASYFTSDMIERRPREAIVELAQARAIPVTPAQMVVRRETVAQDGSITVAQDSTSSDVFQNAKAAFSLGNGAIPDAQLLWYASQGFIGFQLCAVLSQQWLIDKACSIPPRDAIRNGYKVAINGPELEDAPAVIEKIRAADKRYGLKRQCVELSKMARVFGIRIAIFKVDSPDPQYYSRPFNPDGITPGSYRGIVQVDPYWCIPELSIQGAANPASAEFYEPTYWTIQGVRYHKSHLVIVRGPELPDILKPSYQYAGLSLVQRIYERVYAAERTANEGPQLALSKRAMVFYTDTGKALADQNNFMQRLTTWANFRDNFGVKVADKDGDKVEQHDTNLSNFDETVMTQYQLVAAIANMPATKLLGTTPKGFNSSGDYEEASYHEELESIQTGDMEPLISRHHVCLMRSEGAAMGLDPRTVLTVEWPALDAPTAKEEAEIEKTKAETDKIYVEAGAIDGQDVRARIIADPKSGYDGIAAAVPADAAAHLPGATPGAPPPAGDSIALDAAEWDPVTGVYAEAELITNQEFLDPAIVAAKIAAQDFTVQLSPEFVTGAGKRYRVIIDGHHSLAAAVQCGACPVFVEANYAGSDYVNALTQLPAFGQEQEPAKG